MRPRRPTATGPIVISDQDRGLPYSKGLMASSVMRAGVPPAEAYHVAESVEKALLEQGTRQITSVELAGMAAAVLGGIDADHAQRYLQWQAVAELDQPMVILLGGATGVGKSTVATQLAARLGITRVISTDAVREVLRAVFSQELIPTLYVSSFNAGEAVRAPLKSPEDQLVAGFQEQVSAVSVGMKALIARALEEGTDIIVEGAHVVPGFLDGWDEEFAEAVLVPVVLTVSDPDLHRTHFQLRALEAHERPRDRYLTHFEKIRALQAYIVGLAERSGVPVVETFDLDSTVQRVAGIVVAKALKQAQGRAQQVEAAGAAYPVEDLAAGSPKPARPARLKSWELLAARRKGTRTFQS